MIRFIFRLFCLAAIGGAVSLFIAGETSIEEMLFIVFIFGFLYKKLKKKKIHEANEPLPPASKKMGILDSYLMYKAFGAGNPINSFTPSPTVQAYNSSANSRNCNYQDTARIQREEQERREREAFARKADDWDYTYRQLIRQDPQARNEQTRVAEYNKNYFRMKSLGKW